MEQYKGLVFLQEKQMQFKVEVIQQIHFRQLNLGLIYQTRYMEHIIILVFHLKLFWMFKLKIKFKKLSIYRINKYYLLKMILVKKYLISLLDLIKMIYL